MISTQMSSCYTNNINYLYRYDTKVLLYNLPSEFDKLSVPKKGIDVKLISV